MKHRCSTLARGCLLLFITMTVSQGGCEAQSEDEGGPNHLDAVVTPPLKAMTVAQFTEFVGTMKDRRDGEAAKDIEDLQLTCPVRGVSIAAGESAAVGMSAGLSFQRDVIRLDDVVFSDYHVFRTEMRILPN
jgi:hypothetical protein